METYLTKIDLNQKSRRVWNDLGNMQNMHRTISRAFPAIENELTAHHLQKTPRNEFNILHRLDFDARSERAVLLVQSSIKPDWSFLEADYANRIECKTVHEQYSKIENGMKLLFRLQANPTKRVGASYEHPDSAEREEFRRKFRDEKNRRRIALTNDADKIDWLKRKGENAGFRLAETRIKEAVKNAVVNSSPKMIGWREGKKMTFGAVLFEGVLIVTDTEKFRETLQIGIGTGKAYGFGLLSVAPL